MTLLGDRAIKGVTKLKWGFPGVSDGKASACNVETRVQSLDWEDPLEKEMATHSSTLAWKIPWVEEVGGLQSMGPQSRTRLSDFTFFLSLSLHLLKITKTRHY